MKSNFFKTGYSPKDKSICFPEYSIGELIEMKIDHVVSKINRYPYITTVSKEEILWGGKLFSDLSDKNPIRVPLVGAYGTALKHLSGRRPSRLELSRQVDNFGFAMQWPHESIYTMIQSKFRAKTDAFVNNESDIAILGFKYYVDDNGNPKDVPNNSSYEEKHKNYVGGIFLLDVTKIENINEFFMSGQSPKWMSHLLEDAKQYTHETNIKKLDRAESMAIIANKRLIATDDIIQRITGGLREESSNSLPEHEYKNE